MQEGDCPTFLELTYVTSVMLVTCLSGTIGYDIASKVAKHAHKNGLTLKASAIELQALSESDFDRLVRPELMISPSDISESQTSRT